MAISNSSKFKVFYCQSALPTTELQVGGLYVWNGAIYLATSATTTEKLDGLKAGASNPSSGMIAGEYFFNTTDKVLYYYNGSAWVGAQATALSQDVSFTLGTGVTGSGTLSAGATSVTIGVSAIDPTYITAGALANGMTATTQTAGDNSTKIATTAYVDDAISTAAVAVMHYKGTVADATALAAVVDPVVGDVYNLASDGSNWAYSATAPTAGTEGVDFITVTDGYWDKLGSTLDTSVFATLAGDNVFTGDNTFSETTTFSQDIDVTGDVGAATLTISGNGTVGGTLDVTGDLSADDISGVSITTSGNGSIGGTLGVTGATTLSDSLTVSGATTLSSTLGVTGASTFTGAITANGDADFNDDVTIDGGATGEGNGKTFQIGQYVETTYSGPVNFDGAADFDGAVDLGSAAVAATQSAGDNSTKVATTAYVDSAITAGLTWNVIGAVEP